MMSTSTSPAIAEEAESRTAEVDTSKGELVEEAIGVPEDVGDAQEDIPEGQQGDIQAETLVQNPYPEEDFSINGPGYYPVRLGQVFHSGRYCVVRKLGWGLYSNVWLARDREENKFVTLKILARKATDLLLPGPSQRSDELRIMQQIAAARPTHRGYAHTMMYHDEFEFEGPLGKHVCIVTEPLGFGLDNIRAQRGDGDFRVGSTIVKRVVKQILLALEYLHDECGIVHTDLKPDNILFRPRNLDSVIANALVYNPSASYDCGTDVIPHITPVITQSLLLSTETYIGVEVLDSVLSDFGNAQWREHRLQEGIQPAALRAPEVILGYGWDTAADIWNLGCLVAELLIGRWLFQPQESEGCDYQEDLFACMTETLDTFFEPSFLNKCAHRNKFFMEDGSFAHFTGHERPTLPLVELLKAHSELEEDEVFRVERFLRRCLQLIPEKRATAKELIEDPWLADVDVRVDRCEEAASDATSLE
ncbi:kinase-like protein [Trametes sanguinea]|nr:kinase-like protein [Trametes sanguinea]